MKSTIEDVAREAGVSITTVSRALNGNYPVKKETLERVLQAVKKLGYQPNPLARGLINKKTNTIGVVVPGLTNMFFTEVMEGIEDVAREKGYEVFIASTKGSLEYERCCMDKLIEKLVDGIILIDPQTDNIISGYIQEASLKLPVLCVNGFYHNVESNFIISNQEKGTWDALDYLLSLGHRHIVFIRGGESYSYDLKEKICMEWAEENSCKVDIISVEDGNSIGVVHNTAEEIKRLCRKGLNIGHEITAIFACNDLMGVGALNACRELNIDVPGRVSIIGFDNIIISQMTSPNLTTVDQSMRMLGQEAAEGILFMINSKSLHMEKRFVDTVLVKRESCEKNMK
jgi:LacI family transcriptional regulator